MTIINKIINLIYMIKYLLPGLIILLIIIFWNKISDLIYLKFKIRINYIVLSLVILILLSILALLYF
jgi:hypothetical protein